MVVGVASFVISVRLAVGTAAPCNLIPALVSARACGKVQPVKCAPLSATMEVNLTTRSAAASARPASVEMVPQSMLIALVIVLQAGLASIAMSQHQQQSSSSSPIVFPTEKTVKQRKGYVAKGN